MSSITPRVTMPFWALSTAHTVALSRTFIRDAGWPLYILPSQNWWQRLSRWVTVRPWKERPMKSEALSLVPSGVSPVFTM